jgi:hypothetical protein
MVAVLASVVVLLGSVGAGAETLTINTGILAATDTDVFAIHVFNLSGDNFTLEAGSHK